MVYTSAESPSAPFVRLLHSGGKHAKSTGGFKPSGTGSLACRCSRRSAYPASHISQIGISGGGSLDLGRASLSSAMRLGNQREHRRERAQKQEDRRESTEGREKKSGKLDPKR